MPKYEYKVVPAPVRGKRAKGAKGPSGRFANALESIMNQMGAEGWEYQRTDTLPAEERSGLTGKVTVFQNMLVFRREAVPGLLEAAEETLLIEKQSAPAPDAHDTDPAPRLVEMPIWDELDEDALPAPVFTDVLRLRAEQMAKSDKASKVAAQ